MTKTEVDRFRTVPTARVAELEETQMAAQRALAVSKLDREFTQLRDARAALSRIEEGSFGICQECDEDIHPKRLAAVPWATFCIRCQEAADGNVEEMWPNRDFLRAA